MRIAEKHSFVRISSGWPDAPPTPPLMLCTFGTNGENLSSYTWQPADTRPATNQWALVFGTGSISTSTNQAVKNAASSAALYIIDVGGVPATLTCDMGKTGIGNVAGSGQLVLRSNAGLTQYFLAGVYYATGWFLQITDEVAINETVALAGDPFASGMRELTVTDNGSQIQCYFTDTPGTVVTATTSLYNTNQFVGMYVDSANANWQLFPFDNYEARA